jgi:hypothetical protein
MIQPGLCSSGFFCRLNITEVQNVKTYVYEAIPKNSILREFIGGSAFAAEL